MAVPKSKVSKSRGAKRFASNYKVKVPTLVECPQCHAQKQSHRVCAKCGYYDGKQVIVMAENKD
ncbi:MAG: 50S ribosomal protein L32 [Clostridia bacterium]|nr:50S ribosomal protein L32 [Clostridia bacterium]